MTVVPAARSTATAERQAFGKQWRRRPPAATPLLVAGAWRNKRAFGPLGWPTVSDNEGTSRLACCPQARQWRENRRKQRGGRGLTIVVLTHYLVIGREIEGATMTVRVRAR